MNFIKRDFTLMSMMLIPVAIAINIVAGQLTAILKLPIFLDAIGTILVSILAGPWVGAATGFLSNAINSIFDPGFFPFSLVSIAIGIVTGILARKNMFSKFWKLLISGFLIALTSTIVAAPIVAFLFGGVTGSGNTLITGALMATGQNLIQSVFASQFISDIADKIISILISFTIIKSMSDKYLIKFPLGDRFISKK